MDEYRLEAEAGRYFIGRNAIGDNTIGIAGNQDDPNYELNKYVRSHHARIEFVEGFGFCLFVERDGTQAFGGSRTQLLHPNGLPTDELNNPQQPVRLRNGDVIVLGKAVEIEYNAD